MAEEEHGPPREEGEGEGGPESAGGMRWLLTYADMITLLLALFIFLYSISTVEASKFNSFSRNWKALFGIMEHPKPERPTPIEELSTGENLATQIVGSLSGEVKSGLVRVRPRKEETLIYVSDALLFYSPGEVSIRPEGERFLLKLAGVLKMIPNKVRIEGHTDATPVQSENYTSNWELSSARALRVLHTLEMAGVPPDHLRTAAFSSYRPLAPEDVKQGLTENRRVEIAILSRHSP